MVAIIGLLSAIAIPAFLGQRQKAKNRAMVSMVKTVGSELSVALEDYSIGKPILLMESSSAQGCYEHVNANNTDKCSILYNGRPLTGRYANLSGIPQFYLKHRNEALLSMSPFADIPLLTLDPASRNGLILLTNSTDSSINITAWTVEGVQIHEKNVSGR